MAYSVKTVQGSLITRPANATPYAIGDIINGDIAGTGTLIQFANASSTASDTVRLIGFALSTNQAACQAQIRVHFYSASTVSASGRPLDNVALPILSGADELLYEQFIDLPSFYQLGGGSTIAVAMLKRIINFPVRTDGSSIAYCQLQTQTVFTPASAQTFLPTAIFERY